VLDDIVRCMLGLWSVSKVWMNLRVRNLRVWVVSSVYLVIMTVIWRIIWIDVVVLGTILVLNILALDNLIFYRRRLDASIPIRKLKSSRIRVNRAVKRRTRRATKTNTLVDHFLHKTVPYLLLIVTIFRRQH